MGGASFDNSLFDVGKSFAVVFPFTPFETGFGCWNALCPFYVPEEAFLPPLLINLFWTISALSWNIFLEKIKAWFQFLCNALESFLK